MIEGTGAEEGPPGRTLPPTLLLSALSELRSYATVYLERFAARAHPGQVIMLRGPHGTGKTHSIGYTLNRVAKKKIGPQRIDWDVIQLYAKAEEPDLAGLYGTLMQGLAPAELRNLALRFTAEIAADSLADTLDPELAADARERLRERPGLLAGMLREYFVDEGEVVKRRWDEIALCTGGSLEFNNAFRWVDTELGDIAYRWFIGKDLRVEDLHKLGVASPINTAKAARNGLQLLSALCQRAGIGLVMYFDQFEKLVLDKDERLDRDAAGIFHTLVEVLPNQDTMLVIAGNDKAWNRLPPDLQQRFGYKVIRSHGLELREAAALVHLYLRPQDEALVDRETDEQDLHPFTLNALRLLHLYSGGNARELLQLCAVAFDAADGGPIDESAIRAAAENAGAEPVDPSSALLAIRALAETRGFAVRPVPGPTPGWQLSSDGSDRLLVLLGQSTHYYDEVVDTSKLVDVIEELQESMPGVKPMLVTLGYDSPEIRQTLEKAGIEVLSYHPRTFADDFGEIFERLPRDDGAGHDALTKELAELRGELETLRVEREADVRGLAAQATVVEAHQKEEQLASRWQRATNEWSAERRRLEDRIRESRRDRRTEELEELGRLRTHSEKERERRGRWFWLAAAAVLAVALTAAALPSWEIGLRLGVVAFLGGLVLFGWIYWHLLFGSWGVRDFLVRGRLLRDLATPVSSLEDLRRLAYRARMAHPPLRFLLSHPNPQIRYVASVTASDEADLHALAQAIPGERSALVRRAFADRVSRHPDVAISTVEEVINSHTPEAIYILDKLLAVDETTEDIRHLTSRGLLRLLRVMYELRELPPPARALLYQLDAPPQDEFAQNLTRHLSSGLPPGARTTLMKIPFQTLRDCARAVSALDDFGLGTYDDLWLIDDIDRAFLGVSHILFLSEFGLLVDPV